MYVVYEYQSCLSPNSKTPFLAPLTRTSVHCEYKTNYALKKKKTWPSSISKARAQLAGKAKALVQCGTAKGPPASIHTFAVRVETLRADRGRHGGILGGDDGWTVVEYTARVQQR